VFNNDQLNGDNEQHRRLLTTDELDILVVDARVSQPLWYHGLLANIGEGLISAGRFLKQRNFGGHTTLPSQSYEE
jgi:hypothetical protein